MKSRVVLRIHINRPLPKAFGYDFVTAEDGSYDYERKAPLVYTFICKSVEEAKALRDEIVSCFPDAFEEIVQQVKGDWEQ
jgi:hypothetical protein